MTMSRSMLQRLFRQTLRKTILDAILEVRLQRVRELLSQTELSLEEIAQRTGFSYPEYLSTCFRKHDGKTPSLYRRECQAGANHLSA
jgi:LacI family transcriptional regulator